MSEIVEGWLTPSEGELLQLHARACPADAAIVEIGSYEGKSTLRLAAGSREGNGARVYAIDPHLEGSWEALLRNLRVHGVDDFVTPLRMTSEEAARDWDRPIGLLFVDGDHSRAAVALDWKLYSPHLIEGAVVAFHDSTSKFTRKLMGYPGPRAVAARELFRSRHMRRVNFTDTITYATKGDADTGDRFRRWGVRLRKVVPDLLLLFNAHIVRRMPFFAVVKRVVYGLVDRRSDAPKDTR